MADLKITQLTAETVIEDADLVPIVTEVATTPVTKKTTWTTIKAFLKSFFDGLYLPSTNFETISKSLISSDGLRSELHNVMTFSQEKVWTFNGKQYVTFISSDGSVMVGVRTLPNGSWTVQDTGKTIAGITDLHNGSVLGIDPDGYIHVWYDTHGATVSGHYIKSTNPEDITAWTDKTSMTGSNENSITYVKCFETATHLFCTYRNGSSGNGELYMNKFDHSTGTWSAVAHPFINQVSDDRSPYPSEVVVDGNGDFHIAFVWRTNEIDGTWNNYNVCYAKSEDEGVNWKKSDGTAYTLPITFASAEIVDTVGANGGLLNDPRLDVDSSNYPHITYVKEDTNSYENYYHTFFNGTSWTVTKITNLNSYKKTDFSWTGTLSPLPLARPTVIMNGTQAIILFTYPIGSGNLYACVSSAPYTSWKFYHLGVDNWGELEINYDKTYWKSSGVLDIFASLADHKTGGAPVYILRTTPSEWSGGLDYSDTFSEDSFPFNVIPTGASEQKLAEGTDRSDYATAKSLVPFSNDSVYRQALTNANFEIAQRGTTKVISPGVNTYLIDLWRDSNNADGGTLPTITRTQETLTPGEIPGAYKYSRLTVDGAGTSLGVSSRHQYQQMIEKGNLYMGGKKVTLTFYARSSISGKRISPTIYQNYEGGSPLVETNMGTPITLTSSWKKYTQRYTLNSLVGKTFGSAIDGRLHVAFQLMWGTTFGNTDVSPSVTAETFGGAGTIDIAKVQLCVGEGALPFNPKTYNNELISCQRRTHAITTVSATEEIGRGHAVSTTVAYIEIPLPVTMATELAPMVLTATAGDWQLDDGINAPVDVTAISLDDLGFSNKKTAILKVEVASGLTAYRPYSLVGDGTVGRILVISAGY